MATQVQSVGSLQDNAAEVTISYDDVSLLLLSVSVRNDGLPFTLTVTLTDPTTQAVFFTRSRNIGQGTISQNVSGAGILMVSTARGGVRLPFTIALGGS